MRASWNSKSKSETARMPRRMTLAPVERTYSTRSPPNGSTFTRGSLTKTSQDHLNPFVKGEESLFGSLLSHCHGDRVEDLERAPHKTAVAHGQGVEGSGDRQLCGICKSPYKYPGLSVKPVRLQFQGAGPGFQVQILFQLGHDKLRPARASGWPPHAPAPGPGDRGRTAGR